MPRTPSRISTEYLRSLRNKSVLEGLFREGLISYKIYMMLPIREKVDALMRAGRSHGEAVRHVAGEMGMTARNVYYYL
jgi:hypothetical protein